MRDGQPSTARPEWLEPTPPRGSRIPTQTTAIPGQTGPRPAERWSRPGERDVYVTPRTIRIGYEVYPLHNISRVSVHTVEWAERPPAKEVVPPLVVLGIAVLLIIATASSRSAANSSQGLFVFAAAVALLWLLVVMARKRFRTALVIESSGGQATALVGRSAESVHHLESIVLAAIEEPPTQTQHFHIGDIVRGDKIQGNKYQQRVDTDPAEARTPAAGV